MTRFVAYPDRQTIVKYSSLVVLVLQNASLVLFMKFAMTGKRPKFLKSMSVFYAEVFKCVASVCLVMLGAGSLRSGLKNLYTELVHKKKDFAKVLIPAVIYTIQNFLLYVAIENLPAATFMVTYQLKILTTAVFAVVVLKRKLTIQQWIALLFLFSGVAIVQFDQKRSEDAKKAAIFVVNETFSTENATETTSPLSILSSSTASVGSQARGENSLIGFTAVLIACFLSGFAGIYFEKILKGSNVSIWIRNVQLAIPSLIFAFFFCLVKDRLAVFTPEADGIGDYLANMMQGFDWAVWVTVAINAFGGLVVAVVIKFADNILKAFATSFAIVVNCLLTWRYFDFEPSMLFVLGASMVIGAVFVYSIYPYRAPSPPAQEMDDLKKEGMAAEEQPLEEKTAEQGSDEHPENGKNHV